MGTLLVITDLVSLVNYLIRDESQEQSHYDRLFPPCFRIVTSLKPLPLHIFLFSMVRIGWFSPVPHPFLLLKKNESCYTTHS